jgi:hypothetical protein
VNPLTPIPFSQRASLRGDLRIVWGSLLGVFRQLLRSFWTRRGGQS